ncbi:DUF6875 domain-containing protein [Fictibacillus nanhaiensis]|uniref:DUF6875 domain-containing protein n=1 Tax=Fictibacillus nanhaiensis TaxID=742169 RepID=UPI003C1C1CD4
MNNNCYSIGELNYLLSNLEPLKETLNYVSYASKPHPSKGSSGAICPFLPKAIALDSIWCSVIDSCNFDLNAMQKVIDESVQLFESLNEKNEKYKLYKTLVLIFPNIPSERVEEIITGVHRTFKRKLVYRGLMIGEFFTDNSHHGLYNKDFFPLRSNVPLIAIRNLVPEDLPFLSKESDSVEMRIDFLKGYLQTFEGTLDSNRFTKASEMLEDLYIK